MNGPLPKSMSGYTICATIDNKLRLLLFYRSRMKRNWCCSLLLCVLLLPGFACQANSERDVMNVALTHFSTRTDTSSIHEDGIILVEPKLARYDGHAALDVTEQMKACPIDSKTMDILVKSNQRDAAADEIVPKSTRWRVMTKQDEKQFARAFPPATSRSKERVKTVVSLSNPVWTDDGKTATLLFTFRWSIHSAVAVYILERRQETLSVKCSDLVFFV